MKRVNNLFQKIISIENLQLADKAARKGKGAQYGIVLHDKNAAENIQLLHEDLKAKKYSTSAYETFTVYEPKERIVYRLPYRDRIVHHAIMIYLESLFTTVFTNDTYSCIKGKGIHGAQDKLQLAMQDVAGTRYCLKLDIIKFYPNIDHDILKSLLRKKIKDADLLRLLDEIIDSAPGVPIGNYLSQYFANFYLAYFDHWIKESKQVKYYFRYADDLILFSESKAELHGLLYEIRNYLSDNLRLSIKGNYQIFPVSARGVDFVGYKRYHTHVLMRKSIKQSFCRMLKKRCNLPSIASYYGWAVHSNSENLLNKLSKQYDQLQRFRDKANNRSLRRRQNQAFQNIKPGNNCTEIRNQAFEIARGREMPIPSD